MANILVTALCVSGMILAMLYQMYLNPLMKLFGVFHTVQTFGLEESSCKKIPELQACEKIVLHQPSGILYLACSSLESRTNWIPAMERFNAQGRSDNDYVATFDPNTLKITRLEFKNFNSDQPISVHGMDVVPSAFHADELYVYLVNHRTPPAGQDATVVGADSVIELFKTTVSSKRLTHLRTIRDPTIITPNDVSGQADGKGFFFTNDHGMKTGFARDLRDILFSTSSVGYCHLDRGCKVAASGLMHGNGIVKAPSNDTIYVGSAVGAKIIVFERQANDSLLMTETTPTGHPIDNLSVDSDGTIWAAAFPKSLAVIEHMKNSSYLSPVSALKIYANSGSNLIYGEKHKVEKVFEDDGRIVSGSTSVVHDSERNLLFMHGVTASYLTMCHI
ncbi:serum paraoxonase/arylesterase [Gymnopus androsaceus JB14]|uniref:Serum paraoxonase/arylesterase n=1 Tax=Gymnopus androsaceus JB14 TaxID=1447944 RepID=A0A6A4I3Z7_9AGAR|nr:serum paraoxonase/arylesterase [Gymnopus androsaceus JB14]